MNLVLSQGTVTDFDVMLQEDMQYHGDGAVLVKQGDRVAFIPQTASEREGRIQSFTTRINKVKSVSTVVGCVELQSSTSTVEISPSKLSEKAELRVLSWRQSLVICISERKFFKSSARLIGIGW